MRVAWVSHQFARSAPEPARNGLLPGLYAGGAEHSTEEMIAQAPEGVEVIRFRLPTSLPELWDFDRVVVGATEHLSPENVRQLVNHRPVLWVRSPQNPSLLPLFQSARKIMWPSHEAARWHKWFNLQYEISPGPMDVTKIPRGVPKEDFALWAGRSVGHKNRQGAQEWAEKNGVRFVALSNEPRETILEAMGRARWFVHLPRDIIDPCPRTVIEAEIAGCEIVTNELCGRVPVRGADAVAEFVSGAAGRFWEWTLNS